MAILYNLIQKICSSSTSVVVDDTVGTTLEDLCNYLLNCEEDYNLLFKFIELLDDTFEVLKSAGFSFITTEICKNYLVKLRNRK